MNPIKDFANPGKLDIQGFLSLGYLYLLVLGIINDSIYYGFLGINIMKYTTVLDVLMSPLIYITDNVAMPAIIIFIIFGFYWLNNRFPSFHEKHKVKKWYGKLFNVKMLDKRIERNEPIKDFILGVAIGIFFFFLGVGLGGGVGMAKKINNNDIRMDHEIVFTDMEEVKAHLVGQNSLYVFYLVENNKQLNIASLQNIKRIVSLPKSD